MNLSITVPGEPHPQARTRTTKWSSRPYNPSGPSADYRARVTHEAAIAMQGEGPVTGPLAVELVFWLTKPKSKSKKKEYPDVRPDLDNYAKAVFDGLQKVVFVDDAQVCMIRAVKVYTISSPVRTEIEIRSLEEGK